MKKRISSRAVIASVLIAFFPHFGAAHQDKSQASTQIASQGIPDRFIGVWKLRVDNTPHAGTFGQVITIEGQGKNYKFTYDLSVGNGTEDHLWYITEMKGEIVTAKHMNGQPVSGKSRITRIDSSSFKVEGQVQKDVYKVSSDGQTMKLQRTYFVQAGRPNVLRDALLLFDRQK
ncbi:MAG TPA: hypothetical protein VJX70_09230 [Candidatus Acidoferrum sp.]|nr:hypothetical protein [Candidatus Acidoferrum sp.]